jgi:prepilin-type N-terminal cleavage/methylation domain-containing protein
MRALSRHGFTLIELLLGLVLLGIFAGTLVVVVRGAARTAARATQSLLADRALLSLRTFAQQELGDAMSADVTVLAPTRLALSRPIGEAPVCADSGGAILLPDAAWTGTRAPEGGRDDVWLLVDVVAGSWQRLPIDSVSRGRCPLDGAPATRLALAPHAGVAAAARVVEPVELSAYRSGAADWFGLTPASHVSAVQPFAGPLVPSTARFARVPDRLDITVPPRGAPATTLQVPLGNFP